MTRSRDPIRKIERADGTVRWRFIIDIGTRADGKRDQRCYTFDRKTDAVRKRADILSELGRGTYTKPDRSLSVREVAEQWLASKAGKRAATQRSYADALRPLLERYGSMAVQKLDSTHVEKVKKAMLSGEARKVGKVGEPLSARAINLTLTVTRAMLGYAVRRGLVARNPAELVEGVTRDATPGKAWTPDQVSRFLDEASRDRLAPAWRLTSYGLRRSEVLGLEWSRVDVDKGEIFIGGPRAGRTGVAGKIVVDRPKTQRGTRTIPLDDVLVAELRSLRRLQRKERLAAGEAWTDSGLVVVDELGVPVFPETYSNQFRAIAKRAGVPAIRLHDVRHSSTTNMRERGVSDEIVATWHGFDERVMANTYTHTRTAAMRSAVFGL